MQLIEVSWTKTERRETLGDDAPQPYVNLRPAAHLNASSILLLSVLQRCQLLALLLSNLSTFWKRR